MIQPMAGHNSVCYETYALTNCATIAHGRTTELAVYTLRNKQACSTLHNNSTVAT